MVMPAQERREAVHSRDYQITGQYRGEATVAGASAPWAVARAVAAWWL